MLVLTPDPQILAGQYVALGLGEGCSYSELDVAPHCSQAGLGLVLFLGLGLVLVIGLGTGSCIGFGTESDTGGFLFPWAKTHGPLGPLSP